MTSIRTFHPNLPRTVEIIDCTLRDGEQAPGVWFDIEEKTQLAQELVDAGVNLLDAGFPGSGNGDLEAMQEMRRRGIKARLGATARPLPGDISAAAEAGAHEVFLFMPTSDIRLRNTLGISREEATRVLRLGAEEVVSRGMLLNLVFEDASRADVAYMLKLISELRMRVEIQRAVVCDTVGCSHPAAISHLVEEFMRAVADEIKICMHCHNDLGLAVANTLAGVAAGAAAVTCTVNGIGERAGNADLAEVAAALTCIYEVSHNITPSRLESLSQRVEEFSGIYNSAIKPVTGFNVFRHESGVHVDGILKEESSYQFLPPSWAGRKMQYVLGKHSGRAVLRKLLLDAGLSCNDNLLHQLLTSLKAEASTRSKSEYSGMFAQSRKYQTAALSGVDPGWLIAQAIQYTSEDRGQLDAPYH